MESVLVVYIPEIKRAATTVLETPSGGEVKIYLAQAIRVRVCTLIGVKLCHSFLNITTMCHNIKLNAII